MRARFTVLAVLAAMVLAAIPLAADGADALASVNNERTEFTFNNDDGGTLTFSVTNNGSAFAMDVTVTENGRTVAVLEDVEVAGGRGTTMDVSVPMKDFRSVGTHTVVVTCTPVSQFTEGSSVYNAFTATITVEKSRLSDWVTYLVIAIVIIVVVVFVYLKMRDQPKKKPDMTFEQLEEERKAQMADKGGRKKKEDKSPSTEKRRYGGSDEGSKKPSFTDLEEERKAKASKKNESSGSTERQRYLASKRRREE